MSDKIRLKISPVIARFVRPGAELEEKQKGLKAASSLEPVDMLTLFFCMLKDADADLAREAAAALAEVPADAVVAYAGSPDAHPSVLNVLAGSHHHQPEVVNALLAGGHLTGQAREFLLKQQEQTQAELSKAAALAQEAALAQAAAVIPCEEASPADNVPILSDKAVEEDEEQTLGEEQDDSEINEENDQYISKFKVAQIMGIGEKIKMALTGDKEWRAILVKDSNKLVSGSVLKNPRLSDAEVLRILKLGVQSDEIIRLICANREWVKNYSIRKALIDCPKTPLTNSLRYLAMLNDKDLAGYAKSRNISSVLSTQAKRMILAKKR